MRDKVYSFHGASAPVWVLFILLLVFIVLQSLYWLLYGGSHKVLPINVKQRAQFHSIEAALELFASMFGGYPPSDATDDAGQPYCGAMKLAEAIMGQDQMGWHPDSAFRLDGTDPNMGRLLYTAQTLPVRPGAFLPWENANAYRLSEIYGKMRTGPFRGDVYVLCDTYEREQPGGTKAGMPILYFRANPKGMLHDPNDPDNPANIYNWRDNLALLDLGVPSDPCTVHPLTDPKRFYLNTRKEKITQSRPYRADSYILISAGRDGLYGTADDICNFDWKYRER